MRTLTISIISFVAFLNIFSSASTSKADDLDFKKIVKFCVSHHGCTYDLNKNKEVTGVKAYVLSTFKDKEYKIKTLTSEQLKAYVKKHDQLLHQSQYALGVWENGGEVYLDVVTLIQQDHPDALKIAKSCAKKYSQKAIYDLAQEKEIPTENLPEDVISADCAL